MADKLRTREMPPDGHPKPSPEQIAVATKQIEQYYAQVDTHSEPDPGRVTAHRLNRFEYNNTVRDLLGVNVRLADDFPPDPYGYGFDNVSDVLSVSPILTEKYLKAAERAAKAAIQTGPPGKVLAVRYESQALGQQFHMHVQTVHDFPAEGLYNLRVGWEQGEAAGFHMTGHIFLDGKEILDLPIVFATTQDRAFYARNVAITQGPHLIEAQIDVPAGFHGRIPYPTVVEVMGPYKRLPREKTSSYKRIFFKGPPTMSNRIEYNREILTRLAHRAYRRPVTKTDIDRLVHLSTQVWSQGGSFEEGIQVAIEAILMSPDFLFRIEQDATGERIHRVSDVELASRLSYFVWSSMPDDELLSVAEKGSLHVSAILHREVRRMMSDPKAHALAENFGGQWLQTRNLQYQNPDSKVFPEYDVELRDAMRTETEMFFESIVSEDRSVLDFLDGRYTFLNEQLAKLYGIPGVQGREFRRVELDGTERSGVITQASVLTASSYPTRTSPVIRGKWILENILNTPPPPPPPNVPALDDQGEKTAASVRQRLEAHRANPVCAGCHGRMDPLGFALENYDAIGRWRTADGETKVDVSGRLPDGRTFTGAAQLKTILVADSPKFVRGLTEKLFVYALGRGPQTYDKPTIEKISNNVEKNGYRFSVLIDGVVDSMPFQMRERESSPARNLQTASFTGKTGSTSASAGSNK